MRKVKQSSVVAITKAYAEECVASGLYATRPSKADWSAIVAYVTSEAGCLRIPWSFSKLNGEMFGVWVKAYDAAKRRLGKGGKLTKAAPQPKRTRKPKASKKAQPRTYTQAEVEAAIAAAIAALAA